MKNEFAIFFAIPFDSLTRATYEVLKARLTEHYTPGKTLPSRVWQ